MPKLTAEAQKQRQEQLIRYIRKHQPVRGIDICSAMYNGVRQTFANDRNRINKNGIIIAHGKDGYYVVESAEKGEAAIADYKQPFQRASATRQVTNKLSNAIVRQWRILYIISMGYCKSEPTQKRNAYPYHTNHEARGTSFQDLLMELKRCGIKCDKNTLYSDLRVLMQEGLVTRSKGKFPLYYSSSILETDIQELREYRSTATDRSGSSRLKIDDRDEIIQQIQTITPADQNKDVQKANERETEKAIIITTGKKARLSIEQTKAVEKLKALHYLDNALELYYRPRHEEGAAEHFIFYSGLLVYSIETTRLYLFGNKYSEDIGEQKETILDVTRLDFAKTTARTERVSEAVGIHFRHVYREMFGISVDPPVDVRVRVDDRPFLIEKFKRLQAVRERGGNQAEFYMVQSSENGAKSETDHSSFWIYADRIRGMENFARYLRGFGRGIIAEAPKQLVDRMKLTNDLLIRSYTEEDPGDESF